MSDAEERRLAALRQGPAVMTPETLAESLRELADNVDLLVDRLTQNMTDTRVDEPRQAAAAAAAEGPGQPPIAPVAPAAPTEAAGLSFTEDNEIVQLATEVIATLEPKQPAAPPVRTPRTARSTPAAPAQGADGDDPDFDALADRLVDSVKTPLPPPNAIATPAAGCVPRTVAATTAADGEDPKVGASSRSMADSCETGPFAPAAVPTPADTVQPARRATGAGTREVLTDQERQEPVHRHVESAFPSIGPAPAAAPGNVAATTDGDREILRRLAGETLPPPRSRPLSHRLALGAFVAVLAGALWMLLTPERPTRTTPLVAQRAGLPSTVEPPPRSGAGLPVTEDPAPAREVSVEPASPPVAGAAPVRAARAEAAATQPPPAAVAEGRAQSQPVRGEQREADGSRAAAPHTDSAARGSGVEATARPTSQPVPATDPTTTRAETAARPVVEPPTLDPTGIAAAAQQPSAATLSLPSESSATLTAERQETVVETRERAEDPSTGPAQPTPPPEYRAPRIILREEAIFPDRLRKRGLGGVVVLNVLVNESGRVARVVVDQGLPGSELEARAIDAALRSTYRPAVRGEVAVEAWVTERFVFEP